MTNTSPKVEDQERMKATLREITRDDFSGKILIFRGEGASGKTTFSRAIANVFANAGHHSVRNVVVDHDGEDNDWRFKAERIKGNDVVLIHVTHRATPFETSDAKLARRVGITPDLYHELLMNDREKEHAALKSRHRQHIRKNFSLVMAIGDRIHDLIQLDESYEAHYNLLLESMSQY